MTVTVVCSYYYVIQNASSFGISIVENKNVKILERFLYFIYRGFYTNGSIHAVPHFKFRNDITFRKMHEQ